MTEAEATRRKSKLQQNKQSSSRQPRSTHTIVSRSWVDAWKGFSEHLNHYRTTTPQLTTQDRHQPCLRRHSPAQASPIHSAHCFPPPRYHQTSPLDLLSHQNQAFDAAPNLSFKQGLLLSGSRTTRLKRFHVGRDSLDGRRQGMRPPDTDLC